MAVDYISDAFNSAGLKTIDKDYKHIFLHQRGLSKTEGINLVGLIEGSDPVLKSEYIVIGAHYDHLGYDIKEGEKNVFNGADDNASGIASIIEIAKRLNSRNELLKRSVIIAAFDAEEIGLIGSKKFVSQEIVNPENIKLMFSLDMVGMYGKNEGVEFNGIYSLASGVEMIEKTAESVPVKIKKTGKLIEMRTDTWSFSVKGIPAVHVHTGQISPYHKPEDDSDLLDYQGMAIVSDFMVEFITELSNAEILNPDDQVMKKSTAPFFNAGFNYKAGSGNFNYKDEFYYAKSLFALEAGLVFQLKLNKHLVFQPELLYQTSASQSDSGNTRRHSFSPQLNFLLTTSNTRKDKPFAYLMLGGFYSHHFAGKAGGKTMDFKSYYNPQEEGINFGMGLQIYNIQVGYCRKWGLTNVFHDKSTGNVVFNSRYFSLTYLF